MYVCLYSPPVTFVFNLFTQLHHITHRHSSATVHRPAAPGRLNTVFVFAFLFSDNELSCTEQLSPGPRTAAAVSSVYLLFCQVLTI